MLQSKADFRKKYREIRDAIPPEAREKASLALAANLATHPLFLASERIACYIAINGEIDTMPLIKMIWQMGKACYLPVMMEGKTLGFSRFREGDHLRINPQQIFEPESGTKRITPEKLDLVLMPLTVFDDRGHRVGTGGGYYDRTFAFMHGKKNVKPILLGVAYALQQVKSLPADPWDVLLQGVVTEKALLTINN